MTTETFAAIGIIAFCLVVFWFLNTACKWGAATRKREAEFEQQPKVITPDEQGDEIIILNDTNGTAEQRPDGNRLEHR